MAISLVMNRSLTATIIFVPLLCLVHFVLRRGSAATVGITASPSTTELRLRLVYHRYSESIHRKLVINDSDVVAGVKVAPSMIRRLEHRAPDDLDRYFATVHQDPMYASTLEWVDELELVPNVTDKDTVVNMAVMASNAYVGVPGTGDWTDVGAPWTNKSDYGWQEDGLRGHVFSNDDESLVVISIKGTSAAYISRIGGAEVTQVVDNATVKSYYDNSFQAMLDTVTKDKINDNLLFSCCCARVSYLWTTVCNCYKSSYTCDQECLEKELLRKDRYYQAALDLYRNVSTEYPNSTIWLTGHSLGGAMSSLVGRTFGLPAVTFQAPGEQMATERLHLPVPPGFPSHMEHIWHFGNTGDPIFMGVCNGASSTCSLGGYALESQCHSGKVCIYDTVSDLGWSVSIANHRIHTVIDEIILKYNETAVCKQPSPCQDCFNWKFEVNEDNHKYKTTSTTQFVIPTPTSSSVTSTSSHKPKCIRYSWWGRCVEWED